MSKEVMWKQTMNLRLPEQLWNGQTRQMHGKWVSFVPLHRPNIRCIATWLNTKEWIHPNWIPRLTLCIQLGMLSMLFHRWGTLLFSLHSCQVLDAKAHTPLSDRPVHGPRSESKLCIAESSSRWQVGGLPWTRGLCEWSLEAIGSHWKPLEARSHIVESLWKSCGFSQTETPETHSSPGCLGNPLGEDI